MLGDELMASRILVSVAVTVNSLERKIVIGGKVRSTQDVTLTSDGGVGMEPTAGW